MDRFSLMRTWKRAPQLGTRVSKFSRQYFFSLACVAMAIICSFYWSGFPFDNICPNDGIDESFIGENFTVSEWGAGPNATSELVSYSDADVDYRFCPQDLMTPGLSDSFPFVPEKQPEGGEWMTDDQERVTTLFGWSSVVITILVILKFVWGWIDSYKGLFYSSYEVSGRGGSAS